jgi:hypothetical protein
MDVATRGYGTEYFVPGHVEVRPSVWVLRE